MRARGVLVLALAGCMPMHPEPPTIEDHYSTELESERTEMIREARQRLVEIDAEIVELEELLATQPPNPGEDRLAEWRQELYELKQERAQLVDDIDRAEKASPAEWEAMRGTIGASFDGLEAAVDELGEKIRPLFDDDE